MAKKKITRDIPLPSSDGMFGGPGDPKKNTPQAILLSLRRHMVEWSKMRKN